MVSIGRLFAAYGTIPVDKYTTLDVYAFKHIPEFLMGPFSGHGELGDGRRYVLVPRDPNETKTEAFRKIDSSALEQIKSDLQLSCERCNSPANYEINFTIISFADSAIGRTKRACAPHVEQTIKDEKRVNFEITRLNAPMAFSSSRIVSLDQVLAECA